MTRARQQPPDVSRPDRCPISRKDLGACIYEGFRNDCAAFRKTVAMKTGIRLEYCCIGQVEKAVAEMSTKPSVKNQEVVTMGKQKTMFGECESCGEKKTLVSHYDKKVCSSCVNFRGVCKSKPQVVLASIKEFHPELLPAAAGSDAATREDVVQLKRELAEYVELCRTTRNDLKIADETLQKLTDERRREKDELALWMFGDEDGVIAADWNVVERAIALASDRDGLVKKIAELESANLRLIEQAQEYGKTFDATAREISSLRERLATEQKKTYDLYYKVANELNYNLAHGDLDIATEISILKQENERLKDEAQHLAEPETFAAKIGTVTTRDTAILDLALDVLAGRIQGLDADRLQALR